MANLRAPHGVYFVTGNHEYFSGAEAWLNELNRLGIRVLRNERVSIGNATGGFDLAGVDDRSAVRYGGLAPEAALARALAGRDPRRELVLLAHQPRSLLDAEPFGVGLQISGHTHGGQIWPFNFVVRLQQPFVAGLHRRGGAQIYVSRGTGYWGPPMRLGAPAEITEIRLESARVERRSADQSRPAGRRPVARPARVRRPAGRRSTAARSVGPAAHEADRRPRAPTSCSEMSSTRSAGVGTSRSSTEVMTSPGAQAGARRRRVVPDAAHQRAARGDRPPACRRSPASRSRRSRNATPMYGCSGVPVLDERRRPSAGRG